MFLKSPGLEYALNARRPTSVDAVVLYYADFTELVTVLLGYDSASLRRSGGDIAVGCWSSRCIFHVIQEVLSKWISTNCSGTRRGLNAATLLSSINHLDSSLIFNFIFNLRKRFKFSTKCNKKNTLSTTILAYGGGFSLKMKTRTKRCLFKVSFLIFLEECLWEFGSSLPGCRL